MIDRGENGFFEFLKRLRKDWNEQADESVFYLGPNEKKHFAKRKDDSKGDIIERIFQSKPELNEILDRVRNSSGKKITKENLLMYLGYVFYKEGYVPTKISERTSPYILEFCSEALDESALRFCNNIRNFHGKYTDITDLYNAEGITEEKRMIIKQLITTAKLAEKEVKSKRVKTTGEHDEKY